MKLLRRLFSGFTGEISLFFQIIWVVDMGNFKGVENHENDCLSSCAVLHHLNRLFVY